VIDEIDDALRAWLESVLAPTQVDVTFGSPDGQPSQKRPLVSAALYEIVEEENARSNHVDDIRDDAGRVVARQGAARRYVLSYQVSVVASDAATEHRLLGRIVQGGVDRDFLPNDALPEAVRDAGLSVPLEVGKPRRAGAPDGLRIGDEAWRVALEVTLRVPVLPAPVTEIAPPAEQLDLGVHREGGNGRGRTPMAPTTAPSPNPVPLEDRKWTAVRRREH
jgi:hypothetical protein